MIEIERKFLVISDDFKKEAYKKTYIRQGFLNSDKQRVVRIRITDNKGFITVKGSSDASGLSRFEWEKEISKNDAEKLFELCEPNPIEKYRYFIKSGAHIYEVDEFLKENKGLTIAEIELSDLEEIFEKKDWLGEEVTGKIKYYNSNLSKNPFCNW